MRRLRGQGWGDLLFVPGVIVAIGIYLTLSNEFFLTDVNLRNILLQSAILGMHGIFPRPVAVNGQVEVRPMMYIALTYDHRLIDGREAVTALKRVKELVEDPLRFLLEC